jgi:hypothetical protein
MSKLKAGCVSTDGEQFFRAMYDPSVRWNGWIGCPWFDRAEAERIIPWASVGQSFTWDGDVLVMVTHDYADDPGYVPDRFEPDGPDGRYSIGAFAWTWYEDEGLNSTEGTRQA